MLNSLLDKSLLSHSAVAIGGDESQGRYSLHEVIRHFAAEHLQGQAFANELDARFAAYFVAQVESTDRQLYRDDPTQWRLRIGAELDNVRSILQRCLTVQRDSELGLRLASLMGPHWCVAELWKEGCEWINSALTLSKAEGELRAHALTALGELHHLLGEQSRAEGILQDALRRWRSLENADRTAWTLLQLGKVTATYAVNGTADSYLNESLAIYRQLGNQAQVVALLNQMSAVSIQRGDYARAEQVLSELLPIERAAGLPRPIGVVLNYLGRAILDQGDAARALPLLVESLSIFDSERADWGISWTLINLGLAERALGNWAKSASYYWRAFQVYRGLDQVGGLRAACEGLASLAVEIGDFEKSVSLLAAAEKLYRQSGQPLTSYEIKIQQQTFNRTQAALSEPAWKQAWRAGEILTIEQLIALIETLRFAEQ